MAENCGVYVAVSLSEVGLGFAVVLGLTLGLLFRFLSLRVNSSKRSQNLEAAPLLPVRQRNDGIVISA